MITLEKVKQSNTKWFGSGEMSFFGDLSYQIMYGEKSKKPFLVRTTNGWSDMFSGKKRTYYVINIINPETLKVGSSIKDEKGLAKEFNLLEDVKEYLKEE